MLIKLVSTQYLENKGKDRLRMIKANINLLSFCINNTSKAKFQLSHVKEYFNIYSILYVGHSRQGFPGKSVCQARRKVHDDHYKWDASLCFSPHFVPLPLVPALYHDHKAAIQKLENLQGKMKPKWEFFKPKWMYTCIHTYIYTYIHKYMNIYRHTYILTYIHT